MGDVHPRDAQHARQSADTRHIDRRQLPIEFERQILAHLPDILFDQIVVVEQPLRRRRDHLAAFVRLAGRAIGLENGRFVFLLARYEIEGAKLRQRVHLTRGEPRAKLLEVRVGQIACADRIVLVHALQDFGHGCAAGCTAAGSSRIPRLCRTCGQRTIIEGLVLKIHRRSLPAYVERSSSGLSDVSDGAFKHRIRAQRFC
jgi:hypothetical protein